MYAKVKLVDTVRVPPERLGEPLREVAQEILAEKLEGRIDKKLGGMIVSILKIEDISEGKMIPGDGGVYHDVTFEALLFKPMLQEVVEGKVVEVVEYGAFVEIGPMDALIHISQITDDYIAYDEKGAKLIGKEGKQAIGEGDKLRARIVAVSLSEADPRSSKIGLTMRQPSLGKFEWLEEERKKEKK